MSVSSLSSGGLLQQNLKVLGDPFYNDSVYQYSETSIVGKLTPSIWIYKYLKKMACSNASIL